MKKAFTLAEIMVVLVVIGVLTCILTPIVANSIPDKNVMKFKKADTTLKNVIHELVTSGKYYEYGDLSKKSDGNYIDESKSSDIKYFCQTFADLLTTKKVDCKENKTIYSSCVCSNCGERIKESMDYRCIIEAKFVGEEIKTSDNIVYYSASPGSTFSTRHASNDDGNLVDVGYQVFKDLDSNGFIRCYKIICIDVDGIPKDYKGSCDDVKDLCPFGYGIRIDGKILPGARAEKWLAKDFQGNDPSEQE